MVRVRFSARETLPSQARVRKVGNPFPDVGVRFVDRPESFAEYREPVSVQPRAKQRHPVAVIGRLSAVRAVG